MKRMHLCTGIFLLAAIQVAAITISPLPYGTNVHLAQNTTLARVKAAGIAWIRIDINWNVIEASKGRFTFAEVDRVVKYANSLGLSIYATIAYTPAWANGKKGKNYPASKVSDWKNFVARAVARYKNQVKYWGIWNEPNLKDFFALGKDKFVQQVLIPAAQTIHGADPAAFIVGPDLAHLTASGSEWYFWMKYILDNAGGYLDVISHHIYEDLGVYYLYELLEEGDKFIPAVKKIIEESGQANKPFWITETGWNTSRYSEIMQSNRYLDMLHARARKNYPHKVFFYEIIDDPNPAVLPWGILRRNLEPKPAYNTYKEYIAGLLPDPGNPDENKTNKKCYAEQTVNNGAPASSNPALEKLRQARNFLSGYSPSARKTVDIYYDLNEDFMKIALTDSRVSRLGRKIMERAEKLLSENGRLDTDQPLPQDLYRDTRDLVRIIKNEYGDSALAPLALLAERYLSAIDRTSLRDLLEYYLKEDLLNYKKSR